MERLRRCFGWERKGSEQLLREMCPKCDQVVVVLRFPDYLMCSQCSGRIDIRPSTPLEDPLLLAIAKRLGIPSATKDYAYNLFQIAAFVEFECTTSLEGVLAACVFYACMDTHQLRTPREVASAAALGATEREIENVAHGLYVELHLYDDDDDLHAPPEEDYMCAAHYVKPLCRRLGMSVEAVQAAMDAAIKVNDVGGRLQRYLPEVIAAAIIYIVCQLSDEKKTLEDISGACIVDYEELKFAVMNVQPYLEIVKDMELFPKGMKPPEMAGIEKLVGDLCSQLGVSDRATRAAVEAAENVESPRNPSRALADCELKMCVAAGIIYLILILSKEKKSLENLPRVAGLTDSMVAQCLCDLQPQAVHMVPEWYADPEDVNFKSVYAYGKPFGSTLK